MKKKPSLKKPSHGPPRWKIRRAGSGITEKTIKQAAAEEFVKIPLKDWNARIAEASGKNEAVTWAYGILKLAKLPTDPGEMHPRPGGGLCTLLDLVLLSRRKELDAPEWFAAKILTAWHGAEAAKVALLAPQLPDRTRRWYESQFHQCTWELAETAATAKMKFRWEPDVLSHRKVREGASKGGSKAKRLEGVDLYLEGLPKEDLKKSPSMLWARLTLHTTRNPLNVGGYDLYRTEGGLCQDGSEEGIDFETFRKYVYRARERVKKSGM